MAVQHINSHRKEVKLRQLGEASLSFKEIGERVDLFPLRRGIPRRLTELLVVGVSWVVGVKTTIVG